MARPGLAWSQSSPSWCSVLFCSVQQRFRQILGRKCLYALLYNVHCDGAYSIYSRVNVAVNVAVASFLISINFAIRVMMMMFWCSTCVFRGALLFFLFFLCQCMKRDLLNQSKSEFYLERKEFYATNSHRITIGHRFYFSELKLMKFYEILWNSMYLLLGTILEENRPTRWETKAVSLMSD